MQDSPTAPLRGEIWTVDFDPVRRHEQAGMRPCLIVSVDRFNRSRAALVIGIPLTTEQRQIISHVALTPPEGGVRRTSAIMCEQIRVLSRECLDQWWGRVSTQTMQKVEIQLRRIQLRKAWWITTFPGLAIMVSVFSINLIGDALRDALDPQLRGAIKD
jgi:mRNA interferase MazF